MPDRAGAGLGPDFANARRARPGLAGAERPVEGLGPGSAGLGPDFANARRAWPDLAGAERSVEGLGPGAATARGVVKGLESGVEARHVLDADLVLD